MIPLLSRDEVRALDRSAIEQLGLPGIALMENAGAQAAALLLSQSQLAARSSRVLVLGGVGQNGGDGWVVARHLLGRGVRARCVLVGERARVRGDALVNLQVLEALGITVEHGLDQAQLARAVQEASLIVDGLFGTGLDRPLSPALCALVACINDSPAHVVALDLPSGIDADSGQVLGQAVRAHWTVTFAAHKPGLHQHPGVEHAGQVVCAGIGVPLPPVSAGLLQAEDVAHRLPPRRSDAHKGTAGHVLVVAGSRGKTGAALLCGLGAQRAGAGLLTIASDAATQAALEHKVLEMMTAGLSEADALGSALELARGKSAAVVGPGLGVDGAARELARGLALQLPIPCVLDADALSALSERPEELGAAAAPRVLTPHPGEASRLLGISTAQVQAQRFASARELARRTGQVVVLKGARSVVAAPEGALRVCMRGTPALGSGGTGDVLAGAVAALCAQLPPFEAAFCAVELHARAGELAAAADRGLLASEVAAQLPRALEQCRSQSGAA